MINQKGNPLWGNIPKKYKCGCAVIEGKTTCPIHGEAILEQQMIYGNKSETEMINEREKYKEENLNE